jgi:phosphomannomutase
MKELVDERMLAYPCSGEINFRVEDTQPVIDRIKAHFEPQAEEIDTADGISMSFGNWRFSLRASNTEPLLRLNVESKRDEELLKQSLQSIVDLIEA